MISGVAGDGPPLARERTRRLPRGLGARLMAALAAAHRDEVFAPTRARAGAHRVVAIADELGASAIVARGFLDVGDAELEHLWAVVEGRVVDPTLPLRAPAFVDAVRAYVAGDLDDQALVAAAAPWTLEWRVVGDVPRGLRYRGVPILPHRQPAH